MLRYQETGAAGLATRKRGFPGNRKHGLMPDHFLSTGKRESCILMSIHPARLLEAWVFGDFQSSRPCPNDR
ncbi:hypothetical protein [Burkholderia sp. S-53]|uniref:hypothetical protein n=1 Tax=Burkholderia sp. S-53 TaxID=2906514 RepID=UPI0021D0D1CF|nr:hypothetical protein [Burkholderia sp. S-53]UXU86280.1 hypothetical protein LXM88_13910 [Burkholderia sp. S-53]